MAPTHSMDPLDAVRERRSRRVQTTSGLLFFAFASFHVFNQWLVLTGVRRRVLRGVLGRGESWRIRLHHVAGCAPLRVIFGHIAAVRGPSLRFDLFPRFAGPEPTSAVP